MTSTEHQERPRELEGTVSFVTGALGGFGRAICLDLARAGSDIVIHHRGTRQAEAIEFGEELVALGVRYTEVGADSTSVDEMEAAVAKASLELGGVDILVNNAGFMEARKIIDSTLEDWRRTLSIDLDGAFIATRAVLPGMLERGRGFIVNVASQLAFKGAVDFVAYSAAKAGLIGFTRALAREVGPVVRVNAIAPGPVLTPLVAPHATAEYVNARTRDLVVGRMGRSDEIGPVVVFLVSPGASLMHGQTLHVNGGGFMG